MTKESLFLAYNNPPRFDTPMLPVEQMSPASIIEQSFDTERELLLISTFKERLKARKDPKLNLVFNAGCKRNYQLSEKLKKKLRISSN
jgi:hypothetical protein